MFKNYDKTDFSSFDAWKTKVRLICEYRGIDLDYGMVEGTFDLKDLYDKNIQPRQAVEMIGKEIFGLN